MCANSQVLCRECALRHRDAVVVAEEAAQSPSLSRSSWTRSRTCLSPGKAALSSSLSQCYRSSSRLEHGRVAVVDPADPAGGEECDSKVVECWECRMFKAIRERRDRKLQEARGLAARGRHQKEREERCKRAYRDKDALEGNREQDLVYDNNSDLEEEEEEEEERGGDCEEWLPGGRKEPGWVCEVCDEGGKLILCDACGKGFHAKCLGIESVETLPDEWFCQGCSAKSSCPPAGGDYGRGSPTSSNAAETENGGESAPEPPQNVPSCLPWKKQKVTEPPHKTDAPYAAGTSRARAAAATGQIVQKEALDSQDSLCIDVYCDGGEGRKTGTLRPHGREWRVHVEGRGGLTLQEFCVFAKVAPVFCAQRVCVPKP